MVFLNPVDIFWIFVVKAKTISCYDRREMDDKYSENERNNEID